MKKRKTNSMRKVLGHGKMEMPRELFSHFLKVFLQIKRSLFSHFQLKNRTFLWKMKNKIAKVPKTRSEKGRFPRGKTQKCKKAHAAFSARKMRIRVRADAFGNEFVFRRVKIPERDFHAASFFTCRFYAFQFCSFRFWKFNFSKANLTIEKFLFLIKLFFFAADQP